MKIGDEISIGNNGAEPVHIRPADGGDSVILAAGRGLTNNGTQPLKVYRPGGSLLATLLPGESFAYSLDCPT